MVQFVYVGGNHSNLSGASAKGWTIHRRGRRVIRRWGAIEVIHSQHAKYFWKARRVSESRTTLRTVEAAVAFRNACVAAQVEQGYSRLLNPARIRPHRLRS